MAANTPTMRETAARAPSGARPGDHSHRSAAPADLSTDQLLHELRDRAIANEREALGSAIVAGTGERIRGFTFRHAQYREIAAALHEVEEDGDPVTLESIWTELVERRLHWQAGGPAALAEITNHAAWCGFESEPMLDAANCWVRYDAVRKKLLEAEALARGGVE